MLMSQSLLDTADWVNYTHAQSITSNAIEKSVQNKWQKAVRTLLAKIGIEYIPRGGERISDWPQSHHPSWHAILTDFCQICCKISVSVSKIDLCANGNDESRLIMCHRSPFQSWFSTSAHRQISGIPEIVLGMLSTWIPYKDPKSAP